MRNLLDQQYPRVTDSLLPYRCLRAWHDYRKLFREKKNTCFIKVKVCNKKRICATYLWVYESLRTYCRHILSASKSCRPLRPCSRKKKNERSVNFFGSTREKKTFRKQPTQRIHISPEHHLHLMPYFFFLIFYNLSLSLSLSQG